MNSSSKLYSPTLLYRLVTAHENLYLGIVDSRKEIVIKCNSEEDFQSKKSFFPEGTLIKNHKSTQYNKLIAKAEQWDQEETELQQAENQILSLDSWEMMME